MLYSDIATQTLTESYRYTKAQESWALDELQPTVVECQWATTTINSSDPTSNAEPTNCFLTEPRHPDILAFRDLIMRGQPVLTLGEFHKLSRFIEEMFDLQKESDTLWYTRAVKTLLNHRFIFVTPDNPNTRALASSLEASIRAVGATPSMPTKGKRKRISKNRPPVVHVLPSMDAALARWEEDKDSVWAILSVKQRPGERDKVSIRMNPSVVPDTRLRMLREPELPSVLTYFTSGFITLQRAIMDHYAGVNPAQISLGVSMDPTDAEAWTEQIMRAGQAGSLELQTIC